MVNCCVIGCTSRSEQCHENITFHTFPIDEDVRMRSIWVAATGRLNWKPTKYSRICSKHFEARYFRKTLRRVFVMKSATPNLFVHHQRSPLKELCADNKKTKTFERKEYELCTTHSMYNNMNRHNVHKFSPSSYKKHLSPFGRNVLDSLINHWRTGFDNNECRRRHQFQSNQNRGNTREFCGYSRSIPSVPSSPTGEAIGNRELYQTNNFVSNNYHMPELPLDQGPYPSTRSVGLADYEDVHQAVFNDNNFAIPGLPVGRPSEPISINTCRQVSQILVTNSLKQQHDARVERQHFKYVLPPIPVKQMLRDATHSEIPTESVLSSGDLAISVDITNTNDEEILTANDLITPVIDFQNINKNFLSSTKKPIDKICDSVMPAKTFLERNAEKHPCRDEVIMYTEIREKGVTDNVNWDDMFDTELLPDQQDLPHLMQILEGGTNNNFTIEFPKDRNKKHNKFGNKVTKPKTQVKQKNAVSKKIKETLICVSNESENTPKINLRKIKYTKAVKNWLDCVNPNNLVGDEIDVQMNGASDKIKTNMPKMQEMNDVPSYLEDKINAVNNDKEVETYTNLRENMTKKASEPQIQPQVNNKEELLNKGAEERNEATTKINKEAVNVNDSTAIVIEKKPKAKSKKTVQTRLAEKDGKMKFGPPVKRQNASTTEAPEDKETTNKETKDKKAKAKFVPPIKSQIPVKNVTFDVNTIHESNVHLIHDMINSEDNEIAMVVVYSNGFCQLNNHHTEETCVPEGVMIQSYEKFFYLKDNEQNRDLMRRVLEKSHVICYNGKRLLIHLISKYDLELKQNVLNLSDAKIGSSLIDPDNPPDNFSALLKLLGFTPEFTVATECVLQKAAWYTTLLTECFGKLKSVLIDNSVWNVFVEIEMPLLPVIAGMEYQGVCVDLKKLNAMEDILLTKMKTVEQDCYKAAGKTFQINSTLQVRTILYDELQLDTKSNLKIKETIGKGAKSTSETMLRGLVSVHPLPQLILEYRHLHKAHATFLTGIAQHVKDGTVRPSWEQMAAATGRIASNNPNLQAIPKSPFSLVVFPEKPDEQEPTLNFRSVYTARPQHTFLAADFKHIECRVFAHAADDATLQDALRSGQDLFRVLAAKWLNKPVEVVSTEDRERTKRIVYASLYGAGARKLMEILHVGYEQAFSIMTSFNRTFPALKSFGRAVVARASRGDLRSLCGRARRFPHIASTDATLRAQAERQAVNFVVQGSAADLCKKAMVCVQRRLPPGLRCRLVLQIHDELVWELADGDVGAAAAIIKDAMENVGRECGMNMTLPVELTYGPNWGEMQPFQSPDF